MAKYAATTSVTSEKSRAEIERTLSKYGATSFAYGWEETRSVIGFRIENRQVRFVLPLPDRHSREFTHSPERGIRRSDQDAEKAYEQAVRQSWRALLLIVKAKLEAVESDIVTFDQEFFAHLVLPGGRTVFDQAMPQVAHALETGQAPKMIEMGGE